MVYYRFDREDGINNLLLKVVLLTGNTLFIQIENAWDGYGKARILEAGSRISEGKQVEIAEEQITTSYLAKNFLAGEINSYESFTPHALVLSYDTDTGLCLTLFIGTMMKRDGLQHCEWLDEITLGLYKQQVMGRDVPVSELVNYKEKEPEVTAVTTIMSSDFFNDLEKFLGSKEDDIDSSLLFGLEDEITHRYELLQNRAPLTISSYGGRLGICDRISSQPGNMVPQTTTDRRFTLHEWVSSVIVDISKLRHIGVLTAIRETYLVLGLHEYLEKQLGHGIRLKDAYLNLIHRLGIVRVNAPSVALEFNSSDIIKLLNDREASNGFLWSTVGVTGRNQSSQWTGQKNSRLGIKEWGQPLHPVLTAEDFIEHVDEIIESLLRLEIETKDVLSYTTYTDDKTRILGISFGLMVTESQSLFQQYMTTLKLIEVIVEVGLERKKVGNKYVYSIDVYCGQNRAYTFTCLYNYAMDEYSKRTLHNRDKGVHIGVDALEPGSLKRKLQKDYKSLLDAQERYFKGKN